MTDGEKDKFLHDLYYNKRYQTGRDSMFNYIRNTLKNTDISRRYIAAFLAKQETHQLQTARKPTTNIRPIITNRPGAMLQMDLIDFSNKPISGYRYILNVIDTFSRKIWLNQIKKKDIKSVIPALNNIVEDIQKDYKINVIQSDNGGEFNISFPDIKHIQSRPYTPQQQALVERSNGTVKNILNRIMLSEKSKNWVKFLDDVEEVYNSSYNRNLKMSPDEAYQLDPDKQAELHQKQKDIKSKSYKEINKVLKVGDIVRIIIEKGKQKSKGENNWTKELYTIKTVIPANKENFTIPRYKLIDANGVLQRNTYPLSKLLYLPAVETK
jgi:hypothetical protein